MSLLSHFPSAVKPVHDSSTVMPSTASAAAPSCYNVSDCFCITNIPYFLSKVNNLNRFLTIFSRCVQFQPVFYSIYHSFYVNSYKTVKILLSLILYLLHCPGVLFIVIANDAKMEQLIEQFLCQFV